ncbi:hypothetical protein T440DRAFT_487286 [Plenodomus tracheiphilus IPT5]|uniref:Xylanolytic transcriptional activator regulatory domain-containing protein n=1 Tax=Plenodomus tracheiphilus IPT5 TaxID=1408161 RepID=A0A6A7BGX2_9PLEO|nr:hypothetical protein T440DRAFT_487286 [Plenodomus tracheiphilus IPT5]
MDETGPPCKRCSERNLSCVLNKSLQTLIEERSQWKDTMIEDLGRMHSALQLTLAKLSLPPLPPLQSFTFAEGDPSPQHDSPDRIEEAPSCDNSPRLTPREEGLAHAPIDSLYQITRLSALRSDACPDDKATPSRRLNGQAVSDFISRGTISLNDAERLFDLFVKRIDHFLYTIGSGGYRRLSDVRRGSPTLTACILTVAALHDPDSNQLYSACIREFRRLMSASMFDRHMDQDSMRAMCIAAYWLHDLSWMISGYAIRRAMELNLSSSYHRVLISNNEDAMNNLRIWWVLYVCDRHLSILYGRPSIMRDDVSIAGWEKLISKPIFTESDKRLVSQMVLLIIMGNVRDLFGPDTGDPIPEAFAPKLMTFSLQLDHWMGFWSTELQKLHECIGEFPTRGANLHHHIAKLHLHSHVFRGLKGNAIPSHFEDSAAAAVSAAISTVDVVLNDPHIRTALAGIPHYIHSMIAFACVFLLKVAKQYSGQYVEDAVIFNLTTRAVEQFRATPVGKWHLVHMMAEGLEKMIGRQEATPETLQIDLHNRDTRLDLQPPPELDSNSMHSNHLDSSYDDGLFNTSFEETFGTSSFLNFNTGTLDLDFTGFGF